MRNKAILFGSLGALYDLGDLERRAFNAAFAEAGLDWKWDADLYRDLRAGPPDQDLIASFATDRGLVVDADALARSKVVHLARLTSEERLAPRPGVLSVVSAASAAAVPLALATTEAAELVDKVLNTAGGFLSPQLFAFIGTRDIVGAPKPSSQIYTLALSKLAVAPEDVLVIEDTAQGVRAAQGIGLPTLAFPDRYAPTPLDAAVPHVTRLSKDVAGLGCQMRDFALAG